MGRTIQVSSFPYLIPAETVKAFLEEYTGRGTVCALEVRTCKGGQRAYARVQFINDQSAALIVFLAKQRLYYGSTYLKAWECDIDMTSKPKTYVNEMDKLNLSFGCQISHDKFSVLWKQTGVSVKFGFGLKKMLFFFSFNSVEYKLELRYQNIWQITLHRPSNRATNYLLIQLFGAPRIHQKQVDSIYSFFKEVQDDQWVRATDFTPSFCIGLASGICLQLPLGVQIPNFREYLVYYKESDTPFIMENGSPYCSNKMLVPIIQSPQLFKLPFEVLFKICTLVQTGCLPGPKVDANFFQLCFPWNINEVSIIERVLEDMYYVKECCYEPTRWIKERFEKYRMLGKLPKSPAVVLDDGLVYVRRVQVTPCKVYFSGPEVNMSNRVLRNYPNDLDNFLRISFVDEEWEKMYSADLSLRGSKTELYYRILLTLKNGITIGDKKFEFLAFSSSQLRDNSAWMFASRPGLTAADIRMWMGDFSQIKNVAKYAARLGQSFGSSTETLSVGKHEIEKIPDITTYGQPKYVFSDGIGKISADFAHRVAIKCGLKSFTPSAFQIRYAGYKGVVAVDPCSSVKLSLRKSMRKYKSKNTKLDVLAWSKYQPCYLNRQIITLLSTLGIPDDAFLKKQRNAVAQLDSILTDPSRAQDALELMSPGESTNILKEMLKCGYKPDAEPFLSMMLQAFRSSKLLDLRTKARIFIPDGRSMIGCLDETGTLEYGEVFVQFASAASRQFYDNSLAFGDSSSRGRCSIHVGRVVVAKNPCLHPGDVRVLKAVNVAALHHMVDCVVFPQNGMRPHPNECSGSDLDGDVYFVSWDRDLIPSKQISPMDYTAAPTIELDHDVTIEEVQEYFTNYIVNDSLGIIANAHTVFADRELLRAMSQPCIELAQLFSTAVDFPKTGVPAVIPPDLRVKVYPDFMEKSDKTTYESQSVIGKLFREVKKISPVESIEAFTREVARKSYDHDMEVEGFEQYIDEAFEFKMEYDYKLGNLMDYYGIKTEAEILSGGILKMSKSFDRRKDAEAVSFAMRSLRKEARSWFSKKGSEPDDDPYAKASAWYHVTYHHSYWGSYDEGTDRAHFISFPWCVYDKLIHIKRNRSNRIPDSLPIQQQLNRFSFR